MVSKGSSEDGHGGRWKPVGRWMALVVGTAALAVVGALLGLRLAGPATSQTALGEISVRVDPATNGHVDAFIPIADWGIRADAFSGPVVLHVEPRSVDRQALIRVGAGDRARDLRLRERSSSRRRRMPAPRRAMRSCGRSSGRSWAPWWREQSRP
jgi:hypothetical protein